MITIDKAIEIVRLSGGRTLSDDEAEDIAELLTSIKKSKNEMALDSIHKLLDGKEWDADICDNVANIIRNTGRKVEEVES